MPTTLPVQQIGAFARQAVSYGSRAVVIGVTSRGAFAQVDGRRVIFLSTESCAGPLTLNLNLASTPHGLEVGAQARMESGVLRFEAGNLSIDTNTAVSWEPPACSGGALPPGERSSLLAQTVNRLFASPQPKRGFSALLADLLSLPAAGLELSQVPLTAFRRLREESQAGLRCAAFPPAFSAALLPFLGLGGGLTPSGDDLAAGLLLALNRYRDLLAPGFPVQTLNQAVLGAAPMATTALSASLLECAAGGQADQRLVEALDGLAAGQTGPEMIAERLNAYGSSSGVDTLAGFSLALL